jgi:hypothetical protein
MFHNLTAWFFQSSQDNIRQLELKLSSMHIPSYACINNKSIF